MRKLSEIATEVILDWSIINNSAARDALNCMKTMGTITDRFAADPNGYSVVAVFLGNAIGWRGEKARAIKLELRQMSKHPRP